MGVVGLIGEEAWSVTDSKLKNGLILMDPFVAAERSVKELREAGAELIICLSHTGLNIFSLES